MKKIAQFLLKWRYVVASLFLIVSVSLELHGSSIANWNNYGISALPSGNKQQTVNSFIEPDENLTPDEQYIDWQANLDNWVSWPPREDGTIAGLPRMIRSDEWMVQTPFMLSQVTTGGEFVNTSYGYSGMNMIVAYNSPVKDISVIGKPFNWGFLFLSRAKGLSWYWSFKLIAMLLLSFEFSMILTRKQTFLSILGSLWITFTPAVQWWFMQHLGDIVYFSLAMMVAIHYFFHSQNKAVKLFHSILLGTSLVGFILVIYPAFQVPFGFLILLFFIIELNNAINKRQLKGFDWLVMLSTAFWTMAIIGFTLVRSWDAIQATMNTVYPGSRVSVGGGYSVANLSDFFINFILPFKIPSWVNQVEASSSVSVLPLFLPALPFVIRKRNVRDNLFGLSLVIYCLLLTFYAFISIPEILAKVTLFSYVPSSRAWQTLSVVSVFASIWLMGYLAQKLSQRKKLIATVVAVLALVLIVSQVFLNSQLLVFMGRKNLIVFALILLGAAIGMIWQRKSILTFSIVSISLLTGMTVNPLVTGLSVIENKSLSLEIKEIVAEDEEAFWVTETVAYNFPQLFGAKTLNSVRFYPDSELMSVIDAENQYEQAWNRYAHMRVQLTTDETTMSEGVAPDILEIKLNVDDLQELGVSYVLTYQDLTVLFPGKFTEIYSDADNNRIYKLN